MANTKAGLIGRKIGMTQIYAADGAAVAVTVIEAGPNHVVAVKSAAGNDGYDAVQLAFGTQKEARLSKAQRGHLAKANVEPTKVLQEFRVDGSQAGSYTAGQALTVADVFAEGDMVDVAGTCKGSGFSGVMKRWGFKGFIRSHGTHEYFRHGGSIGTRLTPGMVLKGKKMPGQLGNARITIQNLKVIKVDAEQNLLFIKGGVPGPNGGIVRVRKATKG